MSLKSPARRLRERCTIQLHGWGSTVDRLQTPARRQCWKCPSNGRNYQADVHPMAVDKDHDLAPKRNQGWSYGYIGPPPDRQTPIPDLPIVRVAIVWACREHWHLGYNDPNPFPWKP